MSRPRNRRQAGDPSVRAAVVASRRRLAAAFPSRGMDALLAASEGAKPLLLSGEILGGALAAARHPLTDALAFDRALGPRTFLIDEDDRLTEIEQPETDHPRKEPR